MPWRLLVVAVAVVALGAIAWRAWAMGGDDRSAGPLQAGEASSLAWSQQAGVPFAFGVPVLINPAQQDAVLERARLVGATDGLELREAFVGGPDRKYLWFGTSRDWPDPDGNFTDLSPLAGFELAPQSEPAGERGAELVLVLSAARPGRYDLDGVQVDYSVDGHGYRAQLDNRLRVCVTEAKPSDRENCPLPEA